MKFKLFILSTILVALFFTSSIPSSRYSLRIGEEIEILNETNPELKQIISGADYTIVSFWSPSAPESRIANHRVSTLARDYQGKVDLISISLDESSITDEVLKIDGISGNGHHFKVSDFDENLLKTFQVSKGLRYFLIDRNGNLISVSPSKEEIKSLLSSI